MSVLIREPGEAIRKIVTISSKRQITIPSQFFSSLGFSREAECMVRGNELVIRPVRTVSGGEFAEQILSDLIGEGLSGAEQLSEFKIRQAMVRPAVEAMLKDAEAAARGEGEFSSYDDLFGED